MCTAGFAGRQPASRADQRSWCRIAGKPKYAWESDDKVVEGVRALGREGYARSKGIPPRTLDSHLQTRGLRERCHVVQPLARVVDDPEARKTEERNAELKHLRKENKALTEAVVSQERLFDRVVEATRRPVKARSYTLPKRSRKPRRSVICPIYDQQYGQFVVPTDTPGNRGAFSAEVFDRRLARWVEGVTGNIGDYATAHSVEELIIPLGGDNVEGDEIFAGQAWQLEMDPPRQVWELAAKMEGALREVVRFAREEVGVRYIGLYGITGNHGRVGGKRGGARPATYNWDWLFQKILFDKLRGDPIDEVAIEPGGALFFRCAGHEFQAIHGDQIRGWGNLPFYGLAKHDGRSIRLHSRLFRYLLMGHHHQVAEIPNGAGETIVSGDWVGPNNLSGTITAGSRPQQKVLFVSRKWGIAETARIYFEDADEAYAPSPVYGRPA